MAKIKKTVASFLAIFIAFAFLFQFLIVLDNVQAESLSGWQKTFGTPDLERGTSVQQTSDGGYITAGYTCITCEGEIIESDGYLVKTNSKGNLQWEKRLGVGTDIVFGYSVQQTNDGGFIFAGEKTITNEKTTAYLAKTNASGSIQWEKTFGGEYDNWAYCVQQTTDGGYIFVGVTGVPETSGEYDVCLVKTNSSGVSQWQKTFGGSGIDEGLFVRQTSDGGYVITGLSDSFGSGDPNAYLVKTDSSGKLQWQKTFGGSGMDYALSVQQTSDDGYILAGVTESFGDGGWDAYLIKTDSTGKLQWQKTFGGSNNESASSVFQTSDGGYILAGYTDSYGSGVEDAYLVKTDSSGNLLWQKAFGGSCSDWASQVQQTTDGGYIIGGATSSFGAGSDDVYLVKTNESGESGLPPYELYLAEGCTAWGYSCYITIENPNSTSVPVRMIYQTSSGEKSGPEFTMAPLSQATINPAESIGEADFSTRIECTSGLTISADRTMLWNSQGEEGHSAVALTSASRTWYLPEGSSKWGFECFLLIQNPQSYDASCVITYMTQDEGPKDVEVLVPASSRATYNMKDQIGAADASIKVTSDFPIIAERAMYRNGRREGHDSTGTTTPACDYYLAEGATGYDVGFETWVLIQNPNDKENNITITFMTQDGEKKGPPVKMAPNSRQSLKLNNYLPPDTDVSTHVHGQYPIIAERAMYWTSSGQEICHDSIGMDSAHTTFYLPDGQTDNGRETWTLVQNPNSTDVEVEISYLTPTGKGNVTKTETIKANSRKTFNMAQHGGISGRAAILVTCKTSGKKIMVERAMYWNGRGAGTDTIGGYSD